MGRFLQRFLQGLAVFAFLLASGTALADALSDGVQYYQQGEYIKAFGVVKRFAERGDMNAQFLLSHMYQTGTGIHQNAVISGKWMLNAAKEGHREAQFKVALLYDAGELEGFEKDAEQAFFWYEKAAMQGHPLAQLMLGDCYLEGKGVQKDDEEAAYWYEKAAVQGNEDAKKRLSELTSSPEL